jgi:hypothetical protein
MITCFGSGLNGFDETNQPPVKLSTKSKSCRQLRTRFEQQIVISVDYLIIRGMIK